jgi:hypothetical protein
MEQQLLLLPRLPQTAAVAGSSTLGSPDPGALAAARPFEGRQEARGHTGAQLELELRLPCRLDTKCDTSLQLL